MVGFIVVGVILELVGWVLVVLGATSPDRRDLLAGGVPLIIVGTIFFVVGVVTRRKLGGLGLGSLLGGGAVMENGTPARALVTGISETGITVNESPVFGFDLEVRPQGIAPYPASVKQRVPRMLVGAVLPGMEVAVRFDPERPEKVMIDWGEMPRAASEAGAALTAADLVAAIPPERRGSAADVLSRGRRGTARIVGIKDLGDAVALGVMEEEDERAGARLIHLELEVKLPGQDRYPAQVLHWMPARLVGVVGPGRELVVAVGRDDPERHIAVDWDALG